MAQVTVMIANISDADGPVSVQRGQEMLELQQGDNLYATDSIKTGASSVELRLVDGSKVTLGSETMAAFHADASSLTIHLSQGSLRMDSTAGAEENFALRLVTPKGSVEAGGADAVCILNADGSESLYALSVNQGHAVVFTGNDGQQISLTDAGRGAHIFADSASGIRQNIYAPKEIADMLHKSFGMSPDLPMANDANSNQNILLEQSALKSFGESSLGTLPEMRQEAGFISELHSAHSNESVLNYLNFAGGAAFNLRIDSDLKSVSSKIEISGNETYFGDVESISSSTAISQSQDVVIVQDMVTQGVVIAGDVVDVNDANFTAADDKITGQNMVAGTVVGDADTVQNSTFVGGNDAIVFENISGGSGIHGDAHRVENSSAILGDDQIIINGDFTNSIITGDVHTMVPGSSTSWGDDTIIIKGNVGSAAKIYGDDVTGAADNEGGADSIRIGGTLSGEIFAGGGADNIELYRVSGGRVDLGAHDTAGDSLNIHGGSGSMTIINFDTTTDTLSIGGVNQHLTGDGNYGGIQITFVDTLGNVNPTFDVPTDANALEDDSAIRITMQNIRDANGDLTTFQAVAPNTTYGTVNMVNASTGEFEYAVNNADPRVQELGAGDTLTDSFDVTIQDGFGGATTKTVTVTITGTNDALSVSTTELDAATESGVTAGDANASGTINISDLDVGDAYSFNIGGVDISLGTAYYVVGSAAAGYTLSTSTTGNNHFGTIVFSGSGKDFNYNFTLNNANATIDGLAVGASLGLRLPVIASDADSNDSTNIDITIHGANDAPVVANSQNPLTATESNPSLTGNVFSQVSDVDSDNQGIATFKLGASVTINGVPSSTTAANAGEDIVIHGIYGTLTINGQNGDYTYTLRTTQEQIDAFTALGGSTLTFDEFTLSATDAHNLTDSGTLTFNVNGSNEAPTISVTDNTLEIYEAGVGKEVQAGGSIIDSALPNKIFAGILSGNSSVTAGDVDAGDTLSYSVTETGNAPAGTTYADYGQFSFDGSLYSFQLANNATVNGLAHGATVSLTYALIANDGTTTNSVEVTVTITGTNDKPTLSIDATLLDVTHHDLSFDTDGNDKIDGGEAIIASGKASFADVDTDNHGNVVGDTTGGAALSIYVVEGNNAQDDESGPALSGVANLQSVTNSWGEFSINVDTTSSDYGKYTFKLDNDSSAVISLSNGQGKTLYYTIYVQDAHGAWTSEVVTVNIEGVDDAPEITVNKSPSNQDVTEDTDNTAEGAIEIVDLDGGNHALHIGGVAVQANNTTYYVIQDADSGNFTLIEDSSVIANHEHLGTLQFSFGGSFPITYNYIFTLNNANATINGLNAGDNLDIGLKIVASSASNVVTEQTLTITVNGTNDAPIVTHTPPASTALTDDDDPKADINVTGNFSAHDVENGALGLRYLDSSAGEQTVNDSTIIHGTYGSLRIKLSGDYTYTLGGSLPSQSNAVIALTEGQSAQDVFTFYTYDSNGLKSNEVSLTITVNGVDNAPIISVIKDAGTDNEIISKNMVDTVVSGKVSFNDPDSALVLDYTVIDSADAENQLSTDKLGTIVNEYGTFSIAPTADGFTYTFVLDIGSETVQAIGDGGKHTLEYTISSGNISSTVEVIIFGSALDASVTTQDGSLYGKDGDSAIASNGVSDVLIIDGDVTGTVLADGNIFTGTSDLQGGSDYVQINGDLSGSALIIGDIQNDDTVDTSFLLAGKDHISVTGIMSAGIIVGDSYVYNAGTHATTVGKDDVISVAQMTGGTIYGDNFNDAAGANGGDDIITITTGNMQGTSAIYGGGGNDIITIANGTMQDSASIDAGAGNDIITIAKLEGGTVIGGAGNNTITANITNDASSARPVIDLSGGGDDIVNLTVNAGESGNRHVEIQGFSNDTININGTTYTGSTSSSAIPVEVQVDNDTSLFIYFSQALQNDFGANVIL